MEKWWYCITPEQKLPMALQVSGNTFWERTWPNRRWLLARQSSLVLGWSVVAIIMIDNIIRQGMTSLLWMGITHFILWSSALYLLLSIIVTIKVFHYIGDWNPSNDGICSLPMPTSQEVGIQIMSWSIRAFLSFVVSGQIVVCINFIILILTNKYDNLSDALESLIVHGIMTVIVTSDFLVSCEDLPYQSVIMTFLWACIYVSWSLLFNLADLTPNKGNDYVYNLLQWKQGGNELRHAIAISLFTIFSSIFFQVLLVYMKKRILSWKIRHEFWIDIDDNQEQTEDSELAPLHVAVNY